MKKTLLLAITFFSTLTFAQSGRLAEADDLYKLVAYAGAADIYTDLVGSEVDSPAMRAKLADCYYQMGETEKAERCYSEIITSSEITSKDIYQYAQALKENGKYTESDTYMAKFATMEASDSRAVQFNKNKTYLDEIINQEAYFNVNHLSMNTKHVEFGGYPISEGKVCFISDRNTRFAVKRVHSWNDRNYLDFFSANKADDNALTDIKIRARKDNTRYHEGPLCVTPDGSRVYFTRNNVSKGKMKRDEQGIQNLKLYTATIEEDGSWWNVEETALNSK